MSAAWWFHPGAHETPRMRLREGLSGAVCACGRTTLGCDVPTTGPGRRGYALHTAFLCRPPLCRCMRFEVEPGVEVVSDGPYGGGSVGWARHSVDGCRPEPRWPMPDHGGVWEKRP